MKVGSKQVLFSFALVVLLSSCSHQQPFSRKLWNDGNGLEFPYRENMLDNLLQTHHLKGQKVKQVTDSLGRPQGSKKNSIYYDVTVVWDGLPPSYLKRLFIHFNADSVVTRTEVYEHRQKKK